MKYRRLGRTGIEVSEVGYGAWGIGGVQWTGGDDAEARRALDRALDLGLNFIDTALAYGGGHSERLVGEVVRARGERVYVATKVPPRNREWPARAVPLREVFTRDYIIECTEESLRNLGLETIDLQQLHVWHDDWADEPEWLEALVRLREQGKVRYFGLSLNDYQPANALRALRGGEIDTVQVIYNIFEQAPERELFPFCREHQIGVIARVPFDEGGLDRRGPARLGVPARRLPQPLLRRRPQAESLRARRAAQAVLGPEAESLAGAGAALRPQPGRREHGHPGDAAAGARRGQHRPLRRPAADAEAHRAAAAIRLGPHRRVVEDRTRMTRIETDVHGFQTRDQSVRIRVIRRSKA